MMYKLFNNSKTGMHCVQACLQMLLHHFNKPVLSLTELDAITVHNPGKYTWMSDALIWLNSLGIIVESYENFDYQRFVNEGEIYLKTIWSDETFSVQKEFSDLEYERKAAQRIINSSIQIFNSRLSWEEIQQKYDKGFVVMASVNLYTLEGKDGYGSHMVIVSNMDNVSATLFDPDKERPYVVSRDLLTRACIDRDDFNVLFFRHIHG